MTARTIGPYPGHPRGVRFLPALHDLPPKSDRGRKNVYTCLLNHSTDPRAMVSVSGRSGLLIPNPELGTMRSN